MMKPEINNTHYSIARAIASESTQTLGKVFKNNDKNSTHR